MTVWWTKALMFPHKAEVNTCLTCPLSSSLISPARRLKSSSRMWWASWRPIRSNSRSVTLQPTRLTGSGWERMFRRSPGRPRGTLSPHRYLTKANIAGWGTHAHRYLELQAHYCLFMQLWYYCDRSHSCSYHQRHQAHVLHTHDRFLTIDQTTKHNEKGLARSDEPTENYHLLCSSALKHVLVSFRSSLCFVFWLATLLLWFTLKKRHI